MAFRIFMVVVLAAGCAGASNSQPLTQEEVAFYGGAIQNASATQSKKYQSLKELPVTRDAAPSTSFDAEPVSTFDSIDASDGTLADPRTCPSTYVPRFGGGADGYDGNDNNYDAPLDAPLPNTALTGDYDDVDYSDDDDTTFSKPSGFGSSKSDPSPMGSNSSRLPRLR